MTRLWVWPMSEHSAENDAPRICATCGHALTDQERENYWDRCEPCVIPPGEGKADA